MRGGLDGVSGADEALLGGGHGGGRDLVDGIDGSLGEGRDGGGALYAEEDDVSRTTSLKICAMKKAMKATSSTVVSGSKERRPRVRGRPPKEPPNMRSGTMHTAKAQMAKVSMHAAWYFSSTRVSWKDASSFSAARHGSESMR